MPPSTRPLKLSGESDNMPFAPLSGESHNLPFAPLSGESDNLPFAPLSGESDKPAVSLRCRVRATNLPFAQAVI